MYFDDLTLCYYHRGLLDADSWRAPLLAVGWLEHPHGFTCGVAPPGLIETLKVLIAAEKKAHPGNHFRGLHHCSLCSAEASDDGALPSSHINLLIPGAGVVYAAPAGIVHYIQVH